MWEELHAPVVPVVTFGAFDVYPRKAWVNQTGHVTVRYLEPIYPHEASGRDEMMVLLRRRMLESMMYSPNTIGKPVSAYRRYSSVLFNLIMIAILITVSALFHDLLVNQWGVSWRRILGVGSAGMVIITAVLYVYYVYIIHIGSGGSAGAAEATKKKAQ